MAFTEGTDPWSYKVWLCPVLVATVLVALLLKALDIDYWLADAVYAWEGGSWQLRQVPLLADWLHIGGRRFIITFGLAVLLTWAASYRWRRLEAYRQGLLYVVLSMSLTTAVVAALKSISSVYCPWDLVRYGGHVAAFAQHWGSGRCFPSGHAGAGYALFAVFFFARVYAPRWRWWALGIALFMGLVFGITQQLRGAHFISHDLWAATLSWMLSFLLARRMFDADFPTRLQGLQQ